MMTRKQNPLLGTSTFMELRGKEPTKARSTATQLCFSKTTHVVREPEGTILREAYDSLLEAETGSSHAVLIGGHDGTGKTSLVHNLRDSVITGSDSIFITGMHDEAIRRPCHAIICALEELCYLMDSSNAELMERIKRDLGKHLNFLCHLIPRFADLVDMEEEQESFDEDSIEACLRGPPFKLMARSLVRAVTSFHPLVIFVDDMQWADNSTLELLQYLLTDPESKRLLVIGCYRDNEVSEGHPVSAMIQKLGKLQAITSMKIDDFPLELLNDFVARVLKVSDPATTESLSNVVHRMTHGNIFFVVQFLTSLRQKELLYHSLDSCSWEWKIDQILAEMSLTPNVVESIVSKIQLLPDDTQAVLKVAACMGSRFDADVVGRIVEAKKAQEGIMAVDALAASFLNTSACQRFSESPFYVAEQGGLVKRAPKSNNAGESALNIFCFSHDRIRQTALSLFADATEKERAHFENGHLLLQLYKSSNYLLEWYLVVGVDELNKAQALHITKEEKVELAKVNLLAARHVSEHSAFLAATEYLQKSTVLLGEALWEEEYETALAVCSLRARMEFCIGNLGTCSKVVDEIFFRAKSMGDKSAAFKMKLECFAAEGKHRELIELTKHLLADLGAPLSIRGDKYKLKPEITKTKKLLKSRTTEQLQSHKESTSSRDSLIMNLLMIAQGSALVVSQPTKDIFGVIICHMIQLSINRGYTAHTGLAFVLWGTLLNTLGEYKEAERFGKLGLRLRERLPCKECSAKTLVTYGAFIHGMFKPFHEIINYGQDGHRLGIAGGDLGYASLGSLLSTHSRFFCGHPLAMVSEDAKAYHEEMIDYNQTNSVCHMLCYRQLMSNLSGGAPDVLKLEGDCIKNIQSFTRQNQSSESRQVIQFTSMILHCYFGDVKQAEHHADSQAKFKDVEFPMYYATLFPFYRGLVWFSLVKEGKKKYLKNAKSEISQLEKWVKSGFVNCAHTLLLLKAELMSVKKNTDHILVRKAYEEAIRAATRSGFPQHAALANEKIGRFYLHTDPSWSGVFLGRAMALYAEWGAQAKVDLISAEFPKLDASDEVSAQSSTIAWRRRYDGTPSSQVRNTEWVRSLSITSRSVESREALKESGKIQRPLHSGKGFGVENNQFSVIGSKSY